jgi:hypothetical protein
MEIADVFQRFTSELGVIRNLQTKVNVAGLNLSQDERFVLYESMFLNMFRGFENFLEEAFLSYLTGKVSMSARVLPTCLKARDREHARELLVGNAPFLDWTKPGVVTGRCRLWFDTGEDRFYNGINGKLWCLSSAKDVRNHIAHNSPESAIGFGRAVAGILTVAPINPLSPGELLCTAPMKGPSKGVEVLAYFGNNLEETAAYISEKP